LRDKKKEAKKKRRKRKRKEKETEGEGSRARVVARKPNKKTSQEKATTVREGREGGREGGGRDLLLPRDFRRQKGSILIPVSGFAQPRFALAARPRWFLQVIEKDPDFNSGSSWPARFCFWFWAIRRLLDWRESRVQCSGSDLSGCWVFSTLIRASNEGSDA
jgi:hypothetical protein